MAQSVIAAAGIEVSCLVCSVFVVFDVIAAQAPVTGAAATATPTRILKAARFQFTLLALPASSFDRQLIDVKLRKYNMNTSYRLSCPSQLPEATTIIVCDPVLNAPQQWVVRAILRAITIACVDVLVVHSREFVRQRWPQPLTSPNNTPAETFSALAILSSMTTVGFRTRRSMPLMYVRCRPQ